MIKISTKLIAGILASTTLLLGVVAYSPSANVALASGLTDGVNAAGEADQTGGADMDEVVARVINVMLYIIGAVSVIMLIYGGIRYTTSGGNQEFIKTAKNTILYAVIGLIVAIFAFAIVNWVIKIGQG